MNLLLTQLVLIGVALGVYNAYIILWGTTSPVYPQLKTEYSKIWHGIGLLIRFQLAILVANIIYLIVGLEWVLILKWELMYISISAVLYDFLINVIRYIYNDAPPLFYVDNKGVNAIMLRIFQNGTVYWIVRLMFLIGTVIIVIWT